MKKYLSGGEALRICKINRRTFYKAEEKGLIKPVVLIGNKWKGYTEKDALALKWYYEKKKKDMRKK